MDHKRLWFFSFIILCLIISPFSMGTAEAKTLKIGVVTALSGAGALWGKGILDGAQMAVEEVNAKGGIPIGGDKYTIELIPYDDKYTGTGGVAAVNKLVFQDKVKFIIGSISSASVLAFQEITETNKVLILCNSYAREVLSPKKPYSLRVFLTSVEGTPLLVNWISKTYPEMKTALTFGPNDASGWSITKDTEESLAKTPIKLISKEFYERGTKDFYPFLTKVKSNNPSLIYLTGTPTSDAALLVKQGREMGIKTHFFDATSADWRKFVEIAGKDFAEGYTWGAFFDPDDPKILNFEERYKKKFGRPIPTYVDPSFYHATQALLYAFQKAQSLEPEKVRDTLKNIPEFDGVMGKIEWGGKEVYGIDNQILAVYYASQLKGGKQVILKKLR
jgi:branched-chain amino acid transport system substrate-binding protein